MAHVDPLILIENFALVDEDEEAAVNEFGEAVVPPAAPAEVARAGQAVPRVRAPQKTPMLRPGKPREK